MKRRGMFIAGLSIGLGKLRVNDCPAGLENMPPWPKLEPPSIIIVDAHKFIIHHIIPYLAKCRITQFGVSAF